MTRRPTRSAVPVERRALSNWRIHRERQQMREALGRRERPRLGLPPHHRPAPPPPTGPTRRGEGALRELMDPSRESTAPFQPLRDRREARLPGWPDDQRIRAEFEAREAAGSRPSKRPAETSEPPRQRRPTLPAPDAVVKDLVSKGYSAETAKNMVARISAEGDLRLALIRRGRL